ncbi:hypothetical protein M758_2G054700 [Ceratodon purpureus]|nr:hypothetical protein M758_2G054700 [Ceratodon purpureus]
MRRMNDSYGCSAARLQQNSPTSTATVLPHCSQHATPAISHSKSPHSNTHTHTHTYTTQIQKGHKHQRRHAHCSQSHPTTSSPPHPNTAPIPCAPNQSIHACINPTHLTNALRTHKQTLTYLPDQ